MLNIIICEDDNYQREKIENIIRNQVIDLKIECKIDLSTSSPEVVINHLNNNLDTSYIYFLDVELKASIDGIELGKIIRKYDSKGYIVFVTSHMELSNLTFKYKVQALDYISKFDANTLKKNIAECLLEANNDYKKNCIKVKGTYSIKRIL